MLPEIGSDQRTDLIEALVLLGTVKRTALEIVSKRHTRQDEVQSSARLATDTVRGAARLMRRAIATFETDANSQIVAAEKERTKVFAAQANDATEVADHAAAGLAFANAILDVCNPAEQLMLKPLLMGGLAIISKRGQTLAPRCTSRVGAVQTVSLAQAIAAIAGAVHVESGAFSVADAAKCTAVGSGLTMAIVGRAAAVTITACDAEGKQRTTGGDQVNVAVVPVARSIGDGGGAAASPDIDAGTVHDNLDGSYTCSYTISARTELEKGDEEWLAHVYSPTRRVEVKVNGTHIGGSPFTVRLVEADQLPLQPADWRFRSRAADYVLLEEGRRTTLTVSNGGGGGVIADGAGCEPLTRGRHYWEIEVVELGAPVLAWYAGVCRPTTPTSNIRLPQPFHESASTWMLCQANNNRSRLFCTSCAGTGWGGRRNVAVGERMGLLLDLDTGGTLTIYRDNVPCGTIAEGLVGPLLPCVAATNRVHSLRIIGKLEPPPIQGLLQAAHGFPQVAPLVEHVRLRRARQRLRDDIRDRQRQPRAFALPDFRNEDFDLLTFDPPDAQDEWGEY
jgi:hypothetical protein